MQQSAKNKEFAFSRLGPQPAWLAGGCCVPPQTDLNSLCWLQQSHTQPSEFSQPNSPSFSAFSPTHISFLNPLTLQTGSLPLLTQPSRYCAIHHLFLSTWQQQQQ